MIGPNSVATSGHCVYDSTTGGWASSITVIPALNGTTQPFGSATSYYLECGGDWYNYTDNQDDWGIIRINANLGSSTGWLGLRWQSSSYNGTTVNAVGYPASDGTHMYYGSGTVNTSSARTLSGDWDLTGGQSGGPVEKYYSDTGYTALGINRGGGSTYGKCLLRNRFFSGKNVYCRDLCHDRYLFSVYGGKHYDFEATEKESEVLLQDKSLHGSFRAVIPNETKCSGLSKRMYPLHDGACYDLVNNIAVYRDR